MAAEAKVLSMADFAKKLNKEYSNNNLMIKSDIVPAYKRLSSGMMGFDYPLYSGLPYGRLVVFAGLEHSGKTLAACTYMAAYQRENPDKTCVYIDVEHALDLQFVSLMTGLDLSRVYYMSPEGMSGEQILGSVLEMQTTADIGLIVLDSVPAMMPQINLETDFEKDNGMRGTMAKILHKFCPMLCDSLARTGNILIMINQVREAGTTYTGAKIYKEAGGSALSYYASVKVRFGTRAFIKDGEEMKGGDGEGATGFRLKFKITKNKTCACNRGGGFATFDYEAGAKRIDDLITVALQFGFINRENNVTYSLVNLSTGEVITDSATGEVLRGKKAYLIDYLHTHEDFCQKYLAMIQQFITAANDRSLLDKEAAAEIESQERAVESKDAEEEASQKRQILLEDAKN